MCVAPLAKNTSNAIAMRSCGDIPVVTSGERPKHVVMKYDVFLEVTKPSKTHPKGKGTLRLCSNYLCSCADQQGICCQAGMCVWGGGGGGGAQGAQPERG